MSLWAGYHTQKRQSISLTYTHRRTDGCRPGLAMRCCGEMGADHPADDRVGMGADHPAWVQTILQTILHGLHPLQTILQTTLQTTGSECNLVLRCGAAARARSKSGAKSARRSTSLSAIRAAPPPSTSATNCRASAHGPELQQHARFSSTHASPWTAPPCSSTASVEDRCDEAIR